MEKWKQARISVIVPVYNVARFLPACLDSLLGQSHRNLQIILVDDGSADGSGELCDGYGAQDDRVLVIHQENAGVSAARNAGLDRADGEFIAFLDSDDVLPGDAYETLLAAWDGDLVMGRVRLMDEDGTPGEVSKPFGVESLTREEFLEDLFAECRYGYLGFVWDKLYCRSLIEEGKLRFDPAIRLNEDRLFVLQYGLVCRKIAVTERIVYGYRQRSAGVITATRRNRTVTDSEMTVLKSFAEMKHVCVRHSDGLYYLCCRKAMESALDLLNRVSREDREKRKQLRRFLWENGLACLHDLRCTPLQRLKLLGHMILEK